MKKAWLVLTVGLFLCACYAGSALAQPAGKAIVENACSKCHGVKKVEKAGKKAGEWEATLDRMIKKGAQVKPEDRAVILAYLNSLPNQ